jgi:hypothetical protein
MKWVGEQKVYEETFEDAEQLLAFKFHLKGFFDEIDESGRKMQIRIYSVPASGIVEVHPAQNEITI